MLLAKSVPIGFQSLLPAKSIPRQSRHHIRKNLPDGNPTVSRRHSDRAFGRLFTGYNRDSSAL